MTEKLQPNQVTETDSLFKFVAGLLFCLLALGVCFSIGWNTGLGLLTPNTQSEEQSVFLGLISLIYILPKIFYLLQSIYLWVFGIAIAITFHYISSKIPKLSGTKEKQQKINKYFKLATVLSWAVLLAFTAFETGNNRARIEIEDVAKNGCSSYRSNGWSKCHQVTLNDKQIDEGYLLTRGGREIAIFRPEESQLSVW